MASTRFNAVHGELSRQLTQLMTEVESVRSAWQGRGGTSFQLVTQEWKHDQDRMLRALSETAELLRTSGRNYTVADDTSSERVQAIRPLPL
jgi:WXG100 family type VII secretion target